VKPRKIKRTIRRTDVKASCSMRNTKLYATRFAGDKMNCVTFGISVLMAACLTAACGGSGPVPSEAGGPPGAGWRPVFEEQFDGAEAALDARWKFQNGPSSHILCSRWRDNAALEDGFLKMIARKETRAGQDWTAANLWTKQEFKYGYFECRYRYR
jgi:hypothetical protein